jgi:hypothetical protein
MSTCQLFPFHVKVFYGVLSLLRAGYFQFNKLSMKINGRACFIPRCQPLPDILWIGGWAGPRAVMAKINILTFRVSNLCRLARSLGALLIALRAPSKQMEVVVRVERVRQCLWTAASNGPVIQSPGDTWVWKSTAEWYRQGKPKNSEKNLSECHFVHYKSYRTKPSATPGLRCEWTATNRLSLLVVLMQHELPVPLVAWLLE